ncbi:hypothetical protein GCM10020331_063210 [Ectobacillus funiculus]
MRKIQRRFFPSPGEIQFLQLPSSLRIDHFLEEGLRITPFYDPMMAKVIAHGANREEAMQQLRAALEEIKK